MHFKIDISRSVKNDAGIFLGNCIESAYSFGQDSHFTMLIYNPGACEVLYLVSLIFFFRVLKFSFLCFFSLLRKVYS